MLAQMEMQRLEKFNLNLQKKLKWVKSQKIKKLMKNLLMRNLLKIHLLKILQLKPSEHIYVQYLLNF